MITSLKYPSRVTNESAVARVTAHYPPAEISPGEFEEFVTELLGSAQQFVTDLKITLHEKIEGIDGTYDFDATVRYTFSRHVVSVAR